MRTSVYFRIARPIVMLFLGLPLLAGCASTVKNVASTAGAAAGRAAAPALVDQLDQLSQPGNQGKITALGQSAGVQSAAHALGNGVGDGITDEFVAIATGAPTTQGAATTQQAALSQIGASAQAMIEPVVNKIVDSAVRRTMQDLSSHEGQAAATSLSDAIANSAMRGAVRGFQQDASPMIADMIRKQIAPAVGDAVRQQLAESLDPHMRSALAQSFSELLHEQIMPAIRELWDQGATDTLLLPTRPELAPAMRDNAHNIAFGTATGTNDALVHLGVLSDSGQLTGSARLFVWAGAIVVALIGLAALAIFIAAISYVISLRRRPAGRISG